jgi:hypothetical protein
MLDEEARRDSNDPTVFLQPGRGPFWRRARGIAKRRKRPSSPTPGPWPK